jgi:hypothetical protein
VFRRCNRRQLLAGLFGLFGLLLGGNRTASQTPAPPAADPFPMTVTTTYDLAGRVISCTGPCSQLSYSTYLGGVGRGYPPAPEARDEDPQQPRKETGQ